MTNEQIIYEAAIASEIYTEEEAMEMYETEGDLRLHTYGMWKKLGYQVKKGEHAVLCVRLWVPKKRDEKPSDDSEEDKRNRMYLKKSYLFGATQVEKIQNEKAA